MDIELNFSMDTTDGANISFVTNGKLFDTKEYRLISFIEQTDTFALTKVYIYKDLVKIIRTGKILTEMTFIDGDETNAFLSTDFNYSLTMLNMTKKLTISDDNIYIVYQTTTDKEQNIDHILRLKWSKIN